MPGGGDTTSTVHQSNLPQYAKPYYTSLMERGQKESTRPYQPYSGQRIADQSAATTQGLQASMAYANSGTPLLNVGQGYTTTAAGRINQAGNYNPQYQEANYQAGEFDSAAAQKYMSPYMQDVINQAKKEAVLDLGQEQTYRDSEAAKAGAFGGSRAAVQKQMASNAMMDRLTDITVQGKQSAFENAQQQFERDRAADFAGEQFVDQSRQFGANLGLQGAQFRLQAGQALQDAGAQMAEMQKLRDDLTLDRIKAKLGVGQTLEDRQQERLDMAYNDFVNQRDASRQNLQFMSSLLQGVPVSANQNVTQTTPSNPLMGAAGTLTGLQALYALRKQA